MNEEGRTGRVRQILATDLDGTLIPLADNPRNESDLHTLVEQIRQADLGLVFVTGRHLESVKRAMAAFQLPQPDLVICDVGTTIAHCPRPGVFELDEKYRTHLEEIVSGTPPSELREQLPAMDGLRLQEKDSQGPFKLSFYAVPDRLAILVARLQSQLEGLRAPYTIISSVDPFTGNGLIDLLPVGMSKAGALSWWVHTAGVSPESIVFAGDSGNDLAALTAGYRSVVVGNAEPALARRVQDAHRRAGWENRLYLAREQATSGLLEGCRWFEAIPPVEDEAVRERWGATPCSFRRTNFRVWAPRASELAVEIERDGGPQRRPLPRTEDGFFRGTLQGVGPGTLYRYALDDRGSFPDPASRWQPEGVHGASQVVDPGVFAWTDQEWRGIPKHRLIIYELHLGAFTATGTLRAATDRLAELVALGVSAVELMPVVQSSGRWNWGYDGVDLFAPRNTYGTPQDLKVFVDACHALGLAVILDVVYNHVGPEGCYLAEFGSYLSEKHKTPWGKAFNFDGPDSQHVREFIVDNAIEWLEDYHLDGLRVDSVHHMGDDSSPTILEELRRRVKAFAATIPRTIHLIHETNVYPPEFLDPREGPPLCDALWCDDLMYSILTVARPEMQLTERHYRGARDLAQVLGSGYVYEYDGHGPVRVQEKPRPAPLPDEESPVESFVTSLQNHDGVGNHPGGKRIHQLASKAFQKAASGLTLLYPGIPLIFMGEEWAIEAPFPFFCDHEDPSIRKQVESSHARGAPESDQQSALSPLQEETFQKSKWNEAQDGDEDMQAWYRQLITLRKEGLREGWLAMERLRVAHDEKTGIFSLYFTRQYGAAIQVRARLSSVSDAQAEKVAVSFTGHVLLSSWPQWEQREGRIWLEANHTVVSLETGQGPR